MKKSILLCFIILIFNQLYAQNKYTTSSKKAIKLYEEADELLKNRRFKEATGKLLKATEVDDKFAEAHYKLAATYQLFQQDEEALKYYKKTAEVAPDNEKFKGAYYNLCLSYMSKGDYANAQATGEKFMAMKPTVPKYIEQVKKVIADCQFAQEAIKKPLEFKPVALSAPLNQLYLQYFPALTGDQKTIIFTGRDKPISNMPDSDENLYESTFAEGTWSRPKSISNKINSPENEGTASISADGKTLVFTSCDQRGGRKNFGQCDLFISRKVGNEWSDPINLGVNVNSTAWESQPSLSADGKTLFFISNRGGGKGGRDIWVSRLGDDAKWSLAENLSAINTAMNEVSPFIHPNGKTLFFSSEGYPGLGGKDLFKTELVNKEWTTPQNLGYPVNTYEDQLALFISADGKKGYYSVEKLENGMVKSSVLHIFDVPQEIAPTQKSNFVKGIVYDSKSKQKLEAKIDLFDLAEKSRAASVSSDAQNGSYLLVLNQGAEYALEVHRKGYAFKSLTFNYTEGKDIEPLEIDIALDPISQGTIFRLNNIFFDYNKYEIKEKSKTELDELVKFMQENTEVRGEISGHTDNIGVAEANMTLSLNRAKAVYDYLLQAGIDAKRLTFKGYGATKPDASNDTDEGRARNRRIEFKIL
ncbi:MAG: OmpA family protein [Microscillaceae bacterium]|jgi:outer membrane protein OmpA-like peptidoglycan-associated protein/tetratricopeptide (TPR) repeat protein|nr:OmpA family protein [Microscillaceae bacterium]